MTKKELQRYLKLKDEIQRLNIELRELKQSSYLVTQNLDGLPKIGGLSDIVHDIALKCVELQEKINEKEAEAKRLYKEIESCLAKLTAMERTMIRLRYIDGKQWDEICKILNSSSSNTYTVHGRILRKIEN